MIKLLIFGGNSRVAEGDSFPPIKNNRAGAGMNRVFGGEGWPQRETEESKEKWPQMNGMNADKTFGQTTGTAVAAAKVKWRIGIVRA
jgi:hypothetical protein